MRKINLGLCGGGVSELTPVELEQLPFRGT